MCDIGSPTLNRLLDEVGYIDRVINFAAVKHVRTERDVTSLLRMLEVNLLAVWRAGAAVRQRWANAEQFVVSRQSGRTRQLHGCQ